MTATSVAKKAPTSTTKGARMPSIAKLVRVAKRPPAGVKPPYIQVWKAAAIEPNHAVRIIESVRRTGLFMSLPATTPAGPKPIESMMVTKTMNVIHHAISTARTSVYHQINIGEKTTRTTSMVSLRG